MDFCTDKHWTLSFYHLSKNASGKNGDKATKTGTCHCDFRNKHVPVQSQQQKHYKKV